MRIIFFGSGEFGQPTLERLAAEHEVVAVVSQPARPAGRHRQLTPTPIANWAQSAGLHVLTSDNVNEPAFIEKLASLKPEVGIVIAFGQKLSQPLIDATGKLVVNLHASLLPKYRGAAPINWAIINGERETGVSVISLAQKMDAGPVYAQIATPIDPHETAGELHDRLARLGPDAVAQVLDDLARDALKPTVQNESQATRAPKLSKSDGHVEFDTSPDRVRCRIHGLTPWPGVRVRWQQVSRGREQALILRRVASESDAGVASQAPGMIVDDARVAVAGGSIRLLEVQLPGKKPMPIDEFTRGHRFEPGDTLAPVTGD